ncbi:lipid II flippase family protein [Effusibacillus consociatus]|uniref:Lipid II flippase family protein n=1 Tax=Effusibacillus consociatus TaxID=1117041 RepID=A0ABV9PWL1_9BACL
MIDKILLICVFTLTIHMIETLSHSVRLAGVRVGKLAVALSLFNIAAIVSRTANTFQATLTGGLVDEARVGQEADVLKDQFHIILGSASVGTLLGMLLLPTFVVLFSRAIVHLERAGSVCFRSYDGIQFYRTIRVRLDQRAGNDPVGHLCRSQNRVVD